MIKKVITLVICSFLLVGCSLNFDNRCEKGYTFEKDICVKIDEQKAIHKKEEVCLSGYLIDGKCYMNNTTSNTTPTSEYDEIEERFITTCPGGYRLNEDDTICLPVANGTTGKEYWECPKGYTFNEDGIKNDDEIEVDGLNSTCYKRLEMQPKE